VTRQPRLDHHNVALHLGGAKRVCRVGEGGRITVDVEVGALSIVPSGAMFTWTTQGPVDFAHLYVEPNRLDTVIIEVFDRNPASAALRDCVGHSDPLARELYEAITGELAYPSAASKICIETFYQALLVRLLCTHSNLPANSARVRYALAPYRLRRVTDYIRENLAGDLDLSSLASTAGLSRFHFSRAFRIATGMSPHVFIVGLRIEEAKRLLRLRRSSITKVAKECGFRDGAQFAAAFRKSTGQSPTSYRDAF
jgi:AraC family transcriptional regulator